jgi:hypothetical protein
LLIKNPPWLFSLVDKLFFGHFPQIDLTPKISIRASPTKEQKTPDPIDLTQSAGTSDLQESCITDRNDYQNSKMDSGQKLKQDPE